MAETREKIDQELARLTRLAPAGYALGLHIRYAAPLMTIITYAKDWVDIYTARAYALRDPTIAWGLAHTGVARWDGGAMPDPWGIMAEAAKFGLTYGASAACGPMSSRSICGMARGDRPFGEAELAEFAAIVGRLHDLTQPPEALTPAQVEALRLVASGMRHAAAAARIGITESALKARLISARQRLNARSTLEAVQRARDFHLI